MAFRKKGKPVAKKDKKKYGSDGKLVKDVVVVADKKQIRIAIPELLREMFGIKKGDKFRWYIQREGEKMSIRAVYIAYAPCNKFKKPKASHNPK